MAEILDTWPLLVALDIGGTNSRGEVLPFADGKLGDPLFRAARPTPVGDGDAAVLTIMELSRQLLSFLTPQQRGRVAALGLGVPGVLDAATGVVKLAGNLGWRNCDVAGQLERELGLPVFLFHDVTAAGVAEQRLGAGRGVGDVLSVFMGTGIAATITCGGNMLDGGELPEGGRQQVGEIGHLPVGLEGPECGCGQRGCLELYCSARAIGQSYSRALGIDPDGPNAKSSKDLVLALETDPIAKEVWSVATRYLAHGLLTASIVVGPSRIVLGGGLAAAGDQLVVAVRDWLKDMTRVIEVPQIVIAELGQRAGVMGVALLTADRVHL